MYAADLVLGLLRIMVLGENRTPYNLGASEEISILDLAQKVSLCFNPKPSVFVQAQKSDASVLPERYVPDNSKYISEFKVKSYLDVDDAIKRTVNYYKNIYNK